MLKKQEKLFASGVRMLSLENKTKILIKAIFHSKLGRTFTLSDQITRKHNNFSFAKYSLPASQQPVLQRRHLWLGIHIQHHWKLWELNFPVRPRLFRVLISMSEQQANCQVTLLNADC